MNAMSSDLTYLAEIAQRTDLTNVDALLNAFAGLILSPDHNLSNKQSKLCGKIVSELLNAASLDQRVAFAESIAACPDTPLEAAAFLARDHMASAMFVLEKSPCLDDELLLEIIYTKGADHHQAIAQRATLSENITEALIKTRNEYTLRSLIHNRNARISAAGLRELASLSQHYVGLILPLLQRRDLPKEQALRIAEWSSQTIRALVSKRYERPDTKPKLARPVQQTVTPTVETLSKAEETVSNLKLKGRLKPPYLVNALHKRDEDLFVTAFAALIDVAVSPLSKILKNKSAMPLALACRAMGATRNQFDTLFILYRRLKKNPSHMPPEERTQVDAIYAKLSSDNALSAIHAMV